ncbi:MAG: erythromycin biosynthesis sensory transduction protein eryC1, partial [Gemmatimonadetes bacterium]|nr:erythromycin biosynthesis sensory transduction protein eryC1 [Gemmatimonadota bacterium]
VLPRERPGSKHVYHLYVVEHPQRDDLAKYLVEQGVYCGIHYPTAVHEQAPFARSRTVPSGAPVAVERSRRMLSLPLYPGIRREQVERVSEGVHTWLGARV